MTGLTILVAGLFFAYAMYIGSLSARRVARPADFVDAAGTMPAWSGIFATTGIVLASLNLYDHFRLVALYGLPYNQVGVGLVLVALCAALLHKRIWLASRRARIRSPIELLGAYYQSVTVRLFAFVVLLLFAAPFAADCLGRVGDVLTVATGGGVPRTQAIWTTAFFLFVVSAVGGWRGVVYVVAALSFFLVVVAAFTGAFAAATFAPLSLTLADKIPAVFRGSAGIGKDVAFGGIWTTVGILSLSVSLIGIVISPAFIFLGGTTAATRSSFAFSQVWMLAGLACGLLLLVGPLIGGEVAALDPVGTAAVAPSYAGLIGRFAEIDQLAGICFVLMLAASLLIAVAFFVAAGASVLTLDLVVRFVLPDLTGEGMRLAARILLAILYGVVALMATFLPLIGAILGSVTLSLSAQLLPAMVGLCWAPWISRGAVVVGLVAGAILVTFTEPAGIVLFERLFVDLPWGRWPLTVHSAGWGLVANIAFCLLVSMATRGGDARDHRDLLHRVFRQDHRAASGGGAMRAARWSLPLIWAFLAIGPGAILGNDFFSYPMFSEGQVLLGAPSLWVWQIVLWLVGLLLVWWLAYQSRLSVLDQCAEQFVNLNPPSEMFLRPRGPAWIALLLTRVAGREPRGVRR